MSVEAKRFVNNRIRNLGLAAVVIGGLTILGCSEVERRKQIAEEVSQYRYELVLTKPRLDRYDVDRSLRVYTNDEPSLETTNGTTHLAASNVVCPVMDIPKGEIDRVSEMFGCRGSAKKLELAGAYEVKVVDRGEK